MEEDFGNIIRTCPVCQSMKIYYLFSIYSYRLTQCNDCELIILNPQLTDCELKSTFNQRYYIDIKTSGGQDHVESLKRKTANYYLDLIEKYRGEKGGKLIDIGCGTGDLLYQAESRGYDVMGIDISSFACKKTEEKINKRSSVKCADIEKLEEYDKLFDVCILSDIIGLVRRPKLLLEKVHKMLSNRGVLFIATYSTDSRTAKYLKEKWMEFRPEHMFYFNTKNLQSLLFKESYNSIVIERGVKYGSLDYIADYLARSQIKNVSNIVSLIRNNSPERIRQKPFKVVSSGIIALCRTRKKSKKRKLTIVIPAYNEAATIEKTLVGVLNKKIENIDKEIILIESNSDDNTRNIVLKYKNHPDIKLVLEEYAKGKGHAIRSGLKYVNGDFVLIQDADTEYDLEDYDVLIDPLISGREAFVLGSRHGGRTWKIRNFDGNKVLSYIWNIGHVFFVLCINAFYGLRLKDPFTMYKVFRSDCLYGLEFECNRFDFDHEIVIKFVRKGFKPIEIPVNYSARTFSEGKKVSFFRDPWTWIYAILKFRFKRMNILNNIETTNRLQNINRQQ